MDPKLKMYLLWAVILAGGTLIAIIAYRLAVKSDKHDENLKKIRAKQIEELKTQYEQALEEKNRPKALELGRKYYSLVRGGRSTIYDEQAIANDLATI